MKINFTPSKVCNLHLGLIKRMAIVAVFGIMILAHTISVASEKSEPEDSSENKSGLNGYNVLTVRKSSIPITVPIGGTVVPRHEVVLKAQAPGRVVYVVGTEGTRVGPRQLLVGLDDDAMLAKRRAAWAQLAKAVASLQDAHMQLDREIYSGKFSARGGMGLPSMMDKMFTEPMANVMGMGNSELDRSAAINHSRVDIEKAQAAVVQAQSGVDELDSMLLNKKAVSPGRGVVLEKFVSVGDTVQPGQPLVRVANTADLQVKVDLPTRLLFGLNEGMLIPVAIGATDVRLKALLERIYPAADPSRHTVTMKLALPSRAPAAPGMYVQVNIPDLRSASTLLPVVPPSSIIWRGSQSLVFVVNDDNQTELRMVRTGDNLANTVVILSGLKDGERILASPPSKMVAGKFITVN